jgi:glycosyltransferase involved in cell wall biosynthesis
VVSREILDPNTGACRMRVVVDALAASTGGGVTYLRSLLGAAVETDPELELVLVCGRPDPFAELLASDRVQAAQPLGAQPSLARRVAFELGALGRAAVRLGGDVLFCPSEIGPLRSRLPVVLGLQNPNLYERPVDFASPLQDVRLRLLAFAARRSARRASVLVFVSEPFRRRAAPALDAAVPQRVVEPAMDPLFRPIRDAGQSGAPRPYLLSVSDFYPYKNFPLLVEAFALLDRPELRLVIAGRPVDRSSHAETVQRARTLGVDRRVALLGSVPLNEMPALYTGAACFVFPSLLESFGFPPLEAMACGTPVVCSDASVMPELYGDAALYTDARNPAALADTIRRVLSDPVLGSELSRRGRARAHRTSRAGAAGALLSAFREAAA